MADRHNRDIDRAPAPLPQPLQTKVADSHAHLELIFNSEPDDSRLDELIKECESVGVTRIVQVGYSLDQSKWGIKCAEKFLGKVVATVALHPNEAPIVDDLDWQISQIAELAKNYRVRGIGETGLDFYKSDQKNQQFAALEGQLQVARSLDLPVIIHCRDAAESLAHFLRSFWQREGSVRGVMHCWGGTMAETRWFLDLGFYISFSGTLTFKKADAIRESAAIVPLDRLLIETDCPFLAPVPQRGQRNEPSFVKYVAETLAQVRDIPLDRVADQTTCNAQSLFRFALTDAPFGNRPTGDIPVRDSTVVMDHSAVLH